METVSGEIAKTDINGIGKVANNLSKSLKKAAKAVEVWDLKNLEGELAVCEDSIKQLADSWNTVKDRIDHDIKNQREFMTGDDYPRDLENALREAGIPLQGEFPNYEFAPFKMTVSSGEGIVRLSVGRKTDRTSVLSPRHLAEWAAARYRKLVDRRFDARRFCKDLLEAYQVANRLAYKKDEVLWGRAVSLTTIYGLLTVSGSSKRDYPKALYNYELARFKEQFELSYKEYTFEFGFARSQSHALVLVDSKGRESRVSSLTIYKRARESDENR